MRPRRRDDDDSRPGVVIDVLHDARQFFPKLPNHAVTLIWAIEHDVSDLILDRDVETLITHTATPASFAHYLGAIRIAPSKRMTSPLIIMFSMICATKE